MDVSEFYQTFFEEADELLDDMERLLLELDITAPDRDGLDAIFRAAHSIKGGAATFGFQVLLDTTHHLENLLDRVRRGDRDLDRAGIDVLLDARDLLKSQIQAYRHGGSPDAAGAETLRAKLARLTDGSAGQTSGEAPHGRPAGQACPAAMPAKTAPEVPAPASRGRRTLDIRITGVGAVEQAALIEELGLFGEVVERATGDDTLTARLRSAEAVDDIASVLCFVVDAEQLTIADAPAGPEPPAEPSAKPQVPADEPPQPVAAKPGGVAGIVFEKPSAARAPAESSSLRVAIDKIDQIINLVGELVITRSMLAQATAGLDGRPGDALTDGMSQLARNARDLQDAVMSIRMVPMDFAFSRFPRLVRQLGDQLGKRVTLNTSGGATELDKGLIERIMDPLTHLVRNSLDHGIETPEERVAAGKPAAGTLTLAARHEGSNVLIEIGDDGAGLNRDRILAKARENGIAVADDLSDDEVWQLIFAPGFSTAAAVTDVSGRGVGMDVVRRNIQQLGGHVDLRCQPGAGTTVRIVLPLTLAIMDGMAVRVGNEVFILPLGAILESIQADESKVRTVVNRGRVIEVRGDYLALVELRREFAIPAAETRLARGIVVVLQSEGRNFALFVDELIGQQQVVVKNLETHFRRVPGISAATILGDGSVALILDVIALSRASRRPVPTADQAFHPYIRACS